MEDLERILKVQGKQLNDLYHAMVGNDITKDGGLVGKVNDVVSRLKKTEDLTKTLKIYVMILWFAAGSVLTALFAIFIKK